MKAKSQKEIANQSGNALIYVLIAIVLFAALSMTLGRQTDTSEAGALSDEKAEIYANQLIAYAAQAKLVIDQMIFSGADIDDLDFTLPTEAGFNTAPNIYKVYHPEGGGLTPGTIPAEIQTTTATAPVSGWYLGAATNIDWTKTAGTDVILVAHKISQQVCEKINLKITDSTNIPSLTVAAGEIRASFIDKKYWNPAGTNTDLTTDPAGTPFCGNCYKVASLCIQDNGGTTRSFYAVLTDR